MSFQNRMLSVVLILTFSAACSQSEPQIDRSDVERIISTLASDDMQGRGLFTPGIDRAADFLADEFEDIGLETVDGAEGYLQRFHYYSLTPRQSDVSIGSESIPASAFFLTGSQENVSWTPGGNVQVSRIGAADDFRKSFGNSRGGNGNHLVLVDPAHTDIFKRYYNFFGEGARVKALNDGSSSLFVLTDKATASGFNVSIHQDVKTLDLANVVGKITGKRSDEFVLFSAHYDHLGVITPVDGDSIANGANDDASGTTAVVSLARYFKESTPPERTLLFALFTAEESGGFGAQHFSSELDPDQIVAMFNIEMIGKPAVEGPNTAWITGFDRSSFGQILQAAVEGTPYTFYPDPYPKQNLFFRSDNATLARLGVPAHSISTTPIDVDKDYHQVSDEVSTLDLEHMTNTIRAIERAAVTIVSGEATPTRVTIE